MIAMCAINYVFILILVINPVYNGKPKKVINIGKSDTWYIDKHSKIVAETMPNSINIIQHISSAY